MTGVAGRTYDRQQVYLWSLVLLAGRIPHVISRHDKTWILQVDFSNEDAAQREIVAFEQENRDWPPSARNIINESPLSDLRKRTPLVVPVIAALVIFYRITGPWAESSIWFKHGVAANRQILENGEWWRVVTALTLHADLNHLLGNIFIGGLLAYFLCRLLGSGLGWLLILLAGIMGNILNVLLRGGIYQSVGFSTAVFGMVGILSGLQMGKAGSLKGVLLPLGAALSLLAFLGSAGERVDLGAHLWGLVSGIFFGVLLVNIPDFLQRLLMFRYQWLLHLFSGTIIFGAWWLALHF